MPLTQKQIDAAKPAAKPMRLYDAGGLHLEIAPAGGRWWRFAYRFGGKRGNQQLRKCCPRVRSRSGFRPNLSQTCTGLLEEHVKQQISDPHNLLARSYA
ncbi:MAG: Arm DNA-binding domain-containing protein [Betaproteobacteria bacterium]